MPAMAEPGTVRWRGWVLAGGLFGCLALFVSYGIEWVEQEMDLGYGEEARRDRFLAASVFLEGQGIPSEAAPGISSGSTETVTGNDPPALNIACLPVGNGFFVT